MRNKFLSGLLSVAIAFGMWLYVITYVSPGSEDTYYNIPASAGGVFIGNNNIAVQNTCVPHTKTRNPQGEKPLGIL